MAREQILSVPGKIYPGQSEELVNFPMTDYNDLRKVMAVKPHIMDAVSVLFAEQSGMLSEILAYTGGMYSPGMSAAAKKRGNGSKYSAMEKSINFIGNHEYAWRIKNPKGYVYKFTRDAEAPAGQQLGSEGSEFYVYVNRQPVEMDDVFELADGETHIMVVAPPTWTGTDWKLRCRLNASFRGQVVPSFLVSKGTEACLAYNFKPEASEHGSKVRVSFGSWMKNFMTTMRWEWNMTGHAAHTKTDVSWFVYTDETTGKMEPYWMPVWDYEMMRAAQRATEHFLWNGKKAVNPDGSFLADRRGRLYFSGDGAYTQCSKKLRVAYNELNLDHIEEMQKNIKLDSLETVGTPELVVLGGLEFRRQFDRLMRNIFKLEPSVFFHAQNGEMGVKSNFRFYETGVFGRIYILDGDFLDSKYNASLYDDTGTRIQSYRGIIVNVSKLQGGQQNMTLVSRAGRTNVIGEVKGMSNPGAGNVLTTTADIQGKHLLKEIGIAVHNPYCMGEFYKPFKKY